MQKAEQRIVLITRPTRLDNILAKENTISQARFKLKSLNKISKFKTNEENTDFDAYVREHSQYHDSIVSVREQLAPAGLIQVLERKYLSNFVFAPSDIIICLGQDGLVANTMKYLDGQPVIGINPDREAYDGILLPFEPGDALRIVQEVLKGQRSMCTVRMGEACLPDGQSLLAVNDFFIGQRGHASSRYVIKYSGVKEPQISSGVIVSTGMGSTGWMKSIIAGAQNISGAVIGRPYGYGQENEDLLELDENVTRPVAAQCDMFEEVVEEPYSGTQYDACIEAAVTAPAAMEEQIRLSEKSDSVARFNFLKKAAAALHKREYGHSELSGIVGKWDSDELLFAVREPFSSRSSGTSIVFGKIAQDLTLRIESQMGENGVIFSDGMENDFLEFNSGMEATIRLAEKVGRIVI